MAFKAASLAVRLAGRNIYRAFLYSEHIRAEHCSHRAASGFVANRTEARIQICILSFCHHARIKLWFIPFFFSQTCAVRIMDISVEFIFACRRIAHRHGYHRYLIQDIIEIVSAVRPHRHVRCIQTHIAVRIQRILRFPVNHSFITPVPQIIRRSGPAYIIIQTVCMAAETVMGAVNIDSVIKYIRFSVRDIFPGRKIRIICLFFHTFAVPSLPKPG